MNEISLGNVEPGKKYKKLLNFNFISIERNRLTLNFWFCKGMELGKFNPPPPPERQL